MKDKNEGKVRVPDSRPRQFRREYERLKNKGLICTIEDCIQCQTKHPVKFNGCKRKPSIEQIEEHKKQKEHDHEHCCCCGHHHDHIDKKDV